MSCVFEALCAHLKTHPEAEVQDAVKFLYQASFGGGHFLSDPDGAYLYLLKEAEIANLDAPYTEALGEQYARINLSALRELSPKTLFAMFKASSPLLSALTRMPTTAPCASASPGLSD